MDVQRPAPAAASEQPSMVQSANNPSLSRPATREYTRPRLDGSTPDFSGPNKHVPPAEPVQKKQRSGKKLVIGTLVAVVVLSLAGVGAYLYLQMQDEPVAPVVTEEVQAPPADAGVQATPGGVDQVIQEVDQILNSLDDTSDFKENDLSDDSLGL